MLKDKLSKYTKKDKSGRKFLGFSLNKKSVRDWKVFKAIKNKLGKHAKKDKSGRRFIGFSFK